jgi:hypothetical protein
MVPPFDKSSRCANDVTLKVSFLASEHNKKDENRKEDRNGLNPRSKTT